MKIYDKITSGVDIEFEREVENQIGRQVCCQVWSQVVIKAESTAMLYLWSQVCDRVESEIEINIGNRLENTR